MAAQYCVKVSAGEASVEVGDLAARVARLSGRGAAEIEGMLKSGDVAIAEALSYSESLELQRELMRLKIPSKVVSESGGGKGAALLQRGRSDASPSREREAENEMSEGTQVSEGGSISPPNSDSTEIPVSYGSGEENPWAEFFPDLHAGQGAGSDPSPRVVAEVPSARVVIGERASAPAEGASSSGRQVESPGEAEREARAARPDRARLAEAMQFYEERPPYAPRGYDPRPDHVPLLAALFSALAPGAGQIFNGQPEKAQRFALTFFLFVPWYRAVRDAWSYGEQVSRYYAPRPEPGETRRAALFALRWWLAVGLVASLSVYTYGLIEAQREQTRQHAERELVAAMIDVAAVEVDEAIEPALLAATRAHEELAEKQAAFTMSQEERAQRLYIIGYQSCEQRDYEACEATMRRVTTLRAESRDAFRLQAWASVQARRNDPEAPMPEVAPVPTLEEFELSAGPGPRHSDDL
ncbi:hypothetical protein DV096_09390 [Bradymonadaceae bacterium TMQ3]|nr:hypothetical protein DV096_09390 [Bradymonadaceae bacterium TMQ3]TXC75689.1 hypothetical protein FRC91_09295 [Bradymonadales bacterium TMQ1]